MKAHILSTLAAALLATASPAQQPGQAGPWDNDVHLWRTWPDRTAERLAVFERAGVPSLARLADGRLIAAHQWFPADDPLSFDKVGIRFSEDGGLTWTPAQRLRYLLDMLEFEELAHRARRVER